MFDYGTFTFSGSVFQHFHLYLSHVTSAALPSRPTTPHNTTQPTPAGFQLYGLDYSLFTRRY